MALNPINRTLNEFAAQYSTATKYDIDLNLNKIIYTINNVIQECRNLEGQAFLSNKLNNGHFLTNDNLGNIFYSRVNDSFIDNNTINGNKLVMHSLPSSKIKPGVLTSKHIAQQSITTNVINDLAVTSEKVAQNSIITRCFENGAVNENKLDDRAIGERDLASRSVDGSKIPLYSLTNDKFAAQSIGSEHLEDSSVFDNNLAEGSVTGDKIRDNSITTDKIRDGAISGAKIKKASVVVAKFVSNLFTTPNFGTKCITNEKLHASAVDTRSIRDEHCLSYHFNNDAITTQHLQNMAITIDKLSQKCITTPHLADSCVSQAKIIDSTIQTSHIVDKSVTKGKIDDNTLSELKSMLRCPHTYNTALKISAEATRLTAIHSALNETVVCNNVKMHNDGMLMFWCIVDTITQFSEDDYGEVIVPPGGHAWVDNTMCYLTIEYPGTTITKQEIEISAVPDEVYTDDETGLMYYNIVRPGTSLLALKQPTQEEKDIVLRDGLRFTIKSSPFCHFTVLLL